MQKELGIRNKNVRKNVMLIVTENCPLRCTYCYETFKNINKLTMSFETAKRAVDFFLKQDFDSDAVIWDFIGGEPTLEMELIDKIADYIKLRMYELNHKWFNNYIFLI